MHSSTDYIMQFFEYDHLEVPLCDVSRPFCLLAHQLFANLPDNPEKIKALDDLLDAKDHAVRAVLLELKKRTKGEPPRSLRRLDVKPDADGK